MSAQEIRDHLAALREIALRLERFLALSSDPEELAGLLVPDFDAFWWNHPITRANGAAVFGSEINMVVNDRRRGVQRLVTAKGPAHAVRRQWRRVRGKANILRRASELAPGVRTTDNT